jgi:hypothetical protein
VTFLFAYLGPETLLPLTSVIAGVVGAGLMFGRNVLTFGRRIVRKIAGKGRDSAGTGGRVPASHLRGARVRGKAHGRAAGQFDGPAAPTAEGGQPSEKSS